MIAAIDELGDTAKVDDMKQGMAQVYPLIQEQPQDLKSKLRARDWAALHRGEGSLLRKRSFRFQLLAKAHSPGQDPNPFQALQAA